MRGLCFIPKSFVVSQSIHWKGTLSKTNHTWSSADGSGIHRIQNIHTIYSMKLIIETQNLKSDKFQENYNCRKNVIIENHWFCKYHSLLFFSSTSKIFFSRIILSETINRWSKRADIISARLFQANIPKTVCVCVLFLFASWSLTNGTHSRTWKNPWRLWKGGKNFLSSCELLVHFHPGEVWKFALQVSCCLVGLKTSLYKCLVTKSHHMSFMFFLPKPLRWCWHVDLSWEAKRNFNESETLKWGRYGNSIQLKSF